jgi:hypothetical protein
MNGALRAEVRKLRVTRSLWAVPAVGLLVAVVGNALLVTFGEGTEIARELSHYSPLRFGPTNFGLLLVVFGVRLFADETQHRTLAGTFIRNPRRGEAFVAKAITAAAVSVVFCLAVYALVVPTTLVGVAIRNLPFRIDAFDTVALLGRVVVAMVLLSVLGVALGGLLRNRTVALVAVLVWFALAEDLVGALLHAKRFLPSSAVSSLVAGAGGSLSAAAAAALLFAVTAGCVLAASVALDRDVP